MFRIFFIFFCPGEGKGESEAPGGARLFIENPRRGGLTGGWGWGGEGPGGCLRGIGGGGLIFLWGGRNSHQEKGPKNSTKDPPQNSPGTLFG